MNRLSSATSPYLLQHADNPVDWYPWGEEAFARALADDRPLLVSVGYSACHWCHVMEHESFEDEATAAVMNEHFVCVKVDREERPDVDAITMEATVTMTGQGGWPTTVFMTPEGAPFYTGTYFPPEPRHGSPSFRELLLAVSRAWRERRDDLVAQAGRLVEALGQTARAEPSSSPLTAALLDEAEAALARTFEPGFGGFGRAPKFPPSSVLELLLRRDSAQAREMLTRTLDGMAAGGMYDVVGGGFHRYAVDGQWLVPHFEKMLYDNALLASTYLHAWQVTGVERYRSVATETLDYLLRELLLPGGGLASAQDADTDGVEGLTYTWPGDEAAAVGLPPDVLVPWEDGRAVVRGRLDEETRSRALELRASRPQPFLDDKVIASWNGLALAALADAGSVLERDDWLDAAVHVAAFLLGPLSLPDGRLRRSWRDGRGGGEGFLDDYANASHGLLHLHAATGAERWLLEARRLAMLAVERFADAERGGFFLAAADAEPLVTRPKELEDNPLPSGNSMLCSVLLRLGRLWDDDALTGAAVGVLRLVEPALTRAPAAFGWALCALDLHLAPPREVAVVGDPRSPVARAALTRFDPRAVVAVGPSEQVPLLRGKTLVDGRAAVYVCERFTCRAPITDAADLRWGQASRSDTGVRSQD